MQRAERIERIKTHGPAVLRAIDIDWQLQLPQDWRALPHYPFVRVGALCRLDSAGRPHYNFGTPLRARARDGLAARLEVRLALNILDHEMRCRAVGSVWCPTSAVALTLAAQVAEMHLRPRLGTDWVVPRTEIDGWLNLSTVRRRTR
jgi:hypothetical protein